MNRDRGLFTALAACALLAACGGQDATTSTGSNGNGGSGAQSVAVSVDPTNTAVAPSHTQAFAAAVTGTSATSVTWSVQEGSTGGSISSSGLYTAPSTTGTYHVVVTSAANTAVSATATVTVTASAPPPTSSASCSTASLRTTGTIHYFCPSGNDSNNGLSTSTPKASISAIWSEINSMPAGDTVALCRGGVWSDTSNRALSASCSSGNGTCDIRDYGTGALPVINANPSGWYINITGQWWRLWNIDIENQNAISNTSGATLYVNGNAANLDVCGDTLNGGYLGIGCAPSGKNNLNITFRGNTISNAGFSGFWGGGPNVTITGNTFTNNGILDPTTNAEHMHSIYILAYQPTCTTEQGTPYDGNPGTLPVVVTNNTVHMDNCGSGQPLVDLHGCFTNSYVDVENNDISVTNQAGWCTGIMLSGGNSGTSFQNFIFSRNRWSGPGSGGAGSGSLDIRCCTNCTITDNISVGEPIAVGVGGSSNCSYSNGTNPLNTQANGDIIENNSTYLPSGTQGLSGIYIGSGTHTIDSNATWISSGSCGSGTGGHNYCAIGSPAATSIFNNPANGDFSPASSSPIRASGNPSAYAPLAVGSVGWSVTDSGVSRSMPPNAGAF